MSSIQWFPGHMHAARKKAAETMKTTDLVIEVLDARIPKASCNPMVEELRLFRQKPSLRILNKSDLADPGVTKEWITFFEKQNQTRAVAICTRNPADVAKIPELCRQMVPNRGEAAKPLRMMIMGIPNVGKSTLMNMLLKRRVAAVGDEPAVTKSQQRLYLNKGMVLTDTPGVGFGSPMPTGPLFAQPASISKIVRITIVFFTTMHLLLGVNNTYPP